MVFSSVPSSYLDPPNWNQQASHQPAADGIGVGGDVARELPSADGNVPGGARPASMAERARLAKVPLPEPALKCPRCDSTNTKFCYFNNYSLSQPRHFCKTCRRYWTRGGALRNVPVGGGCRRNKRSKSGGGGSKSSAAGSTTAAAAATATSAAGGGATPFNTPPQPHLPFILPPLQPMADNNYGAAAAAAGVALNFTGIHPMDAADFQLGGSAGVISDQYWRLHHHGQEFPLLMGLEPPAAPSSSMGLFPFVDGEVAVDGGVGFAGQQLHGKPTAAGLITQLAAVKMEENPQGLTLPRQYLGIPGSTDHYWGGGGGGGGGWADLSGSFHSSSTSSFL